MSNGVRGMANTTHIPCPFLTRTATSTINRVNYQGGRNHSCQQRHHCNGQSLLNLFFLRVFNSSIVVMQWMCPHRSAYNTTIIVTLQRDATIQSKRHCLHPWHKKKFSSRIPLIPPAYYYFSISQAPSRLIDTGWAYCSGSEKGNIQHHGDIYHS